MYMKNMLYETPLMNCSLTFGTNFIYQSKK